MTNSYYTLTRTIVFSLAMFLILEEANGQCTSQNNGNWNAPGTWMNCGGGVPGAGNAVVINHVVTITDNASAQSILIQNSGGVNARLVHETISKSLVVTNNVTITGSNNAGLTEFVVSGSATATIGGNLTVNKANAINDVKTKSFTRFRVGRELGAVGAASTAQVTIGGDVTVNYTNGINGANDEDRHEITVGAGPDDDVRLYITGDVNLNYNFSNTSANNHLAFQVSNKSQVFMDDLIITMNQGASTGRVRLYVENTGIVQLNGNATLRMNNGATTGGVVSITAENDSDISIGKSLTMDYNEDDGGPELRVESNGSSSYIEIEGDVIMDSEDVSNTLLTNVHNKISATQGGIGILGNIDFRSAGTPTAGAAGVGQYSAPSIQNRIEVTNFGSITFHKNTLNPMEGSYEYGLGAATYFSGNEAQTIPVNLRTTGSPNPTSYKTIYVESSNKVIADRIRTGDNTVFGIVVDLQFNFSSTHTLTSDVSPGVRKGLTLSNGANTTSSTGGYIEGSVRKTCSGAACANTMFHLGDEGVWAPLEINNITGEDATTVFTVQYHRDPPQNYNTLDPVQFNNPPYSAEASSFRVLGYSQDRYPYLSQSHYTLEKCLCI